MPAPPPGTKRTKSGGIKSGTTPSNKKPTQKKETKPTFKNPHGNPTEADKKRAQEVRAQRKKASEAKEERERAIRTLPRGKTPTEAEINAAIKRERQKKTQETRGTGTRGSQPATTRTAPTGAATGRVPNPNPVDTGIPGYTGPPVGTLPGSLPPLPTFQDYWNEAGITTTPVPDISGQVGAAYNPLLDYLKGQVPYWEKREATTDARLKAAYAGMGRSTMDAANFMANLARESGVAATQNARGLVEGIEDTGNVTQESFAKELARLGVSEAGTQGLNEMQQATGKYAARGVDQGLTNANYAQAQGENWAAYMASQKPVADMAYGEAVADLAMKIDAQINNVQGQTAQARTEQSAAIVNSLSDLRNLRLQQETNTNQLRGSMASGYHNDLLQILGLGQNRDISDRDYALEVWKLEHPELAGGQTAEPPPIQGMQVPETQYAQYIAQQHPDLTPEKQAEVVNNVVQWVLANISNVGTDVEGWENKSPAEELTPDQIQKWFAARDAANMQGEENINLSNADRNAIILMMLQSGAFGNKYQENPVKMQ